MNTYKIIFTDIDGTLLDSKSQVPKKTAEFMHQLNNENNIPVVLVSARMPSGMRGIRAELGVHSPMVCYGGGYILDEKEQCIFNQTLEGDMVKELLELMQSLPEISINIYSYDNWYVYEKDKWVCQEEEITGIQATVLEEESVEKTGAFFEVHKFLCMGEPQKIEELEQKIKESFPVAVCRSKPTYLEIMPKQVSKGNALAVLGDYYKITREEMVAFGDGENDIEMIQYAGKGVAMANGVRMLKEAADSITLSNDEEGIRVYLEKGNPSSAFCVY